MRPPLVSVLIPVFNGERFLAECLESILAQKFGDCEILVGDDGSTDGSCAVIERFARRDRRVRWWRNPRNLGIGGSFNACLQAARGEFVKFVLQDDKLLEPSALSQLVELLQSDSSIALVVSASQLIDAHSRVIRVRNRFGRSGVRDGRKVIARCLSRSTNLIGEPSLALFRRSQAARGFDERFRQLLDLELWFHLLEQGRFAFIGEPLCAFRQHPAQQSEVNSRSGAADDELMMLVERYYAKPWMKDVATPQMIFQQMYDLRKAYGARAAPLLAELGKSLDASQYAACWLSYKLTKPFRNCRRWLEKRGCLAECVESDDL